jgi:hypothetical protein
MRRGAAQALGTRCLRGPRQCLSEPGLHRLRALQEFSHGGASRLVALDALMILPALPFAGVRLAHVAADAPSAVGHHRVKRTCALRQPCFGRVLTDTERPRAAGRGSTGTSINRRVPTDTESPGSTRHRTGARSRFNGPRQAAPHPSPHRARPSPSALASQPLHALPHPPVLAADPSHALSATFVAAPSTPHGPLATFVAAGPFR